MYEVSFQRRYSNLRESLISPMVPSLEQNQMAMRRVASTVGFAPTELGFPAQLAGLYDQLPMERL
jgi:hypothetical protein